MSFFEELKRRNVIRVAIAYGIGAWFILQLSDVVLENINAPEWVMQTIMLVLLIGFPLAVIFAWAFEMTPEGLKKEKDIDRSIIDDWQHHYNYVRPHRSTGRKPPMLYAEEAA